MGPKWPSCPTKDIQGKTMKIILIYLLGYFVVLNYKKNPYCHFRVRGHASFGITMTQ